MYTIGIVALAIVVAAIAFFGLYRPWHLRWGATAAELAQSMPGDDIVRHPVFNATRAVTVNAQPQDIWPWIVQLGFHRAGWYTYDWLDNIGQRSAERIVPELQNLRVGDLVPLGPGENAGMWVKELEPNRWMVWWGKKQEQTTWTWMLSPMPDGTTSLVTRVRAPVCWRDPLSTLWLLMFEIADFPMMRKCMLGIKRRAEKERTQIHLRATESTAKDEGHMARAVIENVVDINRPPTEVFDYASDHLREPEWNPGMRSVRKLTDGPVGLGTRYEMEFVPGQPMAAACEGFDRPRSWAVSGRVFGMDVTLGGEVSATAAGSHLVFRTVFRSRGVRALALPLIRRRMSPLMQRNVERIKAILESAPAQAMSHG